MEDNLHNNTEPAGEELLDGSGPGSDCTEPVEAHTESSKPDEELAGLFEELKPKKKRFDLAFELYDWAHSLVFAFVGFVLVLSFGAGIFSVSQTSMTNTLQEGEMVIVSRLPYTPKNGDIVLFVKHGWEGSRNHKTGLYNPLIKRVIGIEGDTLEYDGQTLKVNGNAVDEPYILNRMQGWEELWFSRDGLMTDRKLTVPEGKSFVMGDNRGGSLDSRNAIIGFVDNRSILGPAVLRVSPLNKFGPIKPAPGEAPFSDSETDRTNVMESP